MSNLKFGYLWNELPCQSNPILTDYINVCKVDIEEIISDFNVDNLIHHFDEEQLIEEITDEDIISSETILK